MYVFYDGATGAVTFTATGEKDIVEGRSDWIEVPAQDLGALDGWGVIDGALVMTSLLPIKRQAVDAVNSAAGDVRQHFVSDLPGQDMVYLRKEAEARRWLAELRPDLEGYPFLAAEVGITAETPDQLAQVWLNLAALWQQIAAGIEHHRFAASAAIAAAQTTGEVTAAVATFNATMAYFRA